MNKRAAMTALVMAVAVVMAAAVQALCPPVPGVHLKAPFLLGVPVYYAMRRGAWPALVSAVWCGALDDGLGNLPWGVSFAAFPLIAALCLVALRRQLSESLAACMVAAAAGGVLLQALQAAALAFDGRHAMPPFLFVAARLVAAAAVSGLAGGAVAAMVRHWDASCGNAGIVNEGDTYGWRAN